MKVPLSLRSQSLAPQVPDSLRLQIWVHDNPHLASEVDLAWMDNQGRGWVLACAFAMAYEEFLAPGSVLGPGGFLSVQA